MSKSPSDWSLITSYSKSAARSKMVSLSSTDHLALLASKLAARFLEKFKCISLCGDAIARVVLLSGM